MKTGFIGLGAMGFAMAGNLHKAGLLSVIWNRSSGKARAFEAATGVKAAATIAELASDCECVVTCVSADDDVLAVADALAGSLAAGTLVIDCSTVSATTAKAAAFVPQVAGVIPHGVDTERFTPAADRQAAWDRLGYGGRHGIGIVGRIRPEKGTDLFVDALLRVLPKRPDFTAVIIGRAMPADAEFQRRLRQRVESAGLTERFIFAGEVPPQAMPSLMQSLSLLVAPARYEGYGMTPLEAMASGVAVVASETGVYPEIIRNDVGRLVPIGDACALSEAIIGITGSADDLHHMGLAARRLAESRLSLRHESAGYAAIMQQMWENPSFRYSGMAVPNLHY